jgi:hypothetical protein
MSNIDFSKQLIKGRVAENIFELMFRETGKYDILQLGYEHIAPELAQYQHLASAKQMYENIRHIPDFVLISNDKKDIYFVEVKYRTHPSDQENLQIVEDILKHYNFVFIFLATPEKFYFDMCEVIKEHGGKMNELKSVDYEIQEKYRKLLLEFIK